MTFESEDTDLGYSRSTRQKVAEVNFGLRVRGLQAVFPFFDLEFLAGDDGTEHVDLVLKGVGPRQLRFFYAADGLRVENLDEAFPLTRNTSSPLLQVGDTLRVGPHELEIVEVHLSALLRGLSAPYLDRCWAVAEQTLIGRGQSRPNVVDLNQNSVSRSHATVRMIPPDRYALESESQNSRTVVNGRVVEKGQTVPLPSGALIKLGDQLFRFETLLPTAHSSVLRIFSLDRFELEIGSRKVHRCDWPAGPSLWLFAYLAAHWPGAIPLASVFEEFWPEMETSRARNNLKNCLWHIKRVVALPPGSPPLLVRGTDHLQLQPDLTLQHDLLQLEQRLEDPKGLEVTDLLLYQGRYLEECTMAWAERLRVGLRSRFLAANAKLMKKLDGGGDAAELLQVARHHLEIEPCCEDTAIRMMSAYRKMGRPESAVRVYQACQSALRRDLDLEPSTLLNAELERSVKAI